MGENAILPENFGEYKVLEWIGRGAEGDVYRAYHRHLKRVDAIKVIRADHLTSPEALARFRLEVEAQAALDHPNIVPVYGAGEVDGKRYLSMKWIDGGSLSKQIDSFRDSVKDSVRLIVTIARAVHHAHCRGILHRDIKPGNILINTSGEALIADFGLAKQLDTEAGLTETGAIVGTPAYMAPEQASGSKDLTVVADVYALGAVLYDLLTGSPPFTGANLVEILEQVKQSPPTRPRALNPAVDPDLEAVCLKCLEKDPRDRYPSADALADELDRYVQGESVEAQSPGIRDWIRQAMRTRPRTALDHSWPPLVWMGAIRLACHSAIFALGLAKFSVVWVWFVMGVHCAGFAIVIWYYLARRFRRLPRTTRHSMMIAIGHLLAIIGVGIAYVPFSLQATADQAYPMYPALAALHGVVFFILGSTHWSRFYFFGLGALALVPVMAFWSEAAPLLHGVSYAACMWYWAYSLGVTFARLETRA